MGDKLPERPSGYDELLGGIVESIEGAYGGGASALAVAQVEDAVRASASQLVVLARDVSIGGQVADIVFRSERLGRLLPVCLQKRGEPENLWRVRVDRTMLAIDDKTWPGVMRPCIGICVGVDASLRYAVRRTATESGVDIVDQQPPELAFDTPDPAEFAEALLCHPGWGA